MADEFTVIDRVDAALRDDLVSLFQSAWWTAARTPEAIERMLDSSDVVVGLIDSASGRLIGFARAITDRTFLAVVLDRIVALDFRGSGLGARLMDELLSRPALAAPPTRRLDVQRLGRTNTVGNLGARSAYPRRSASSPRSS